MDRARSRLAASGLVMAAVSSILCLAVTAAPAQARPGARSNAPVIPSTAFISVHVDVLNFSFVRLTLQSSGVTSGIFTPGQFPPTVIPASNGLPGKAAWQSESDGIATGTEGFASYLGVSLAIGTVLVTFFWDDPAVGSNSYGCSVPLHNLTCTTLGGSGYHANVTFVLTRRVSNT